jgi:hypothetical protein
MTGMSVILNEVKNLVFEILRYAQDDIKKVHSGYQLSAIGYRLL